MVRQVSEEAFKRAGKCIPGGVNSPVRSFGAVGGSPLFVDRAAGPHVFDLDGNRYVDFLSCWGATILGHAHPAVCDAIANAAAKGTGFGLSTEPEVELAQLIKDAFPSIELVRLVNSGTEAVMSAVRLARAHTGRNKVVVFEGCYHGHSDGLLARAGSGLATFSIPRSAGVPGSVVSDTLIATYNDLGSVEALLAQFGGDVAAVLVEPIAGNMGVVPPQPGFLEGLRELCDEHGVLLVFDEVITGFRVAPGGAQELFNVRADLTTLGKIIGGGLPVGAFGGRRDIMEHLAPLGNVYQAGTLSGNPVVANAGAAVLKSLRAAPPYAGLDRLTDGLVKGVRRAAEARRVPLHVNRCGSMFTCFFADAPVVDYTTAKASDTACYAAFFRGMLDRGILLPPSQFEAAFLSAAHTGDEMAAFGDAADEALCTAARTCRHGPSCGRGESPSTARKTRAPLPPPRSHSPRRT
ncbi:MAG: glutamate-1-semialdehyde 2,1-aminomutase [Planctomycetota bacterium]